MYKVICIFYQQKINQLSSCYISIMSLAIKLILLTIATAIVYLCVSQTPISLQPLTIIQNTTIPNIEIIPQINNDRLQHALKIQLPQQFIQDIAVDRQGNIYVAAGEGPSSIYKISYHNYSIYTKIGQTEHRVLGTNLNINEDLLGFVQQKKLKVIDLKTFQIRTLADNFNGNKFQALNSLVFNQHSNIIYFSQINDIGIQEHYNQILYKLGRGAVYSYNLHTGEVAVVANNLKYPNGLAYSSKQNCLYVNQMFHYRIIKIFLQQNRREVLIDNLMGTPDNLKFNQDGKLWVAIPMIRNEEMYYFDANPIIRKIMINLRLPEWILKKLIKPNHASALKINPSTGQIQQYFFGNQDKINFITSIVERKNKLYLVSLMYNRIVVVDSF